MTQGTGSRRSPVGAGLLSFLWPGLGQAWQGRRGSGLLWALPPLAVLAAVVIAALDGLDVLAVELITPTVALTALILVVLVGLWRILSILDAVGAGRPRSSAGAIGAIAVLLVLVVGMHSVAAYYTWSAYDAGNRIFVGSGPDSGISGASASSGAAATDNSQDFQAAPAATPASATARINVLFTGIDSGNGRDHALTDTLLVASINPETKKVSLLSIPRDIANFPLWDGRTFQGKINSLMTYARLHPKEFPDGGLPTLIKEIGYLLGVPIHYYAAINLEGFVRMVDLVGGVDIVNQQQISDPTYLWFDQAQPGFNLSTGPHHLDGRTALAYVRSRKGIGDSDFTRARRQQEVLLALARRLATPAMLTQIPDLLQAAGDAVRTNFPQDRVGEMVQLDRGVTSDNAKQVVLGPPYASHPPTNTTGGVYELRLDMAKLAAISIEFFGTDSAYYVTRTANPSPSAAP
jgi:LCP family protein required for cell wall assembly